MGFREQGGDEAFGPKGEEVTREWERLRNEVLYDQKLSVNIIRMIK